MKTYLIFLLTAFFLSSENVFSKISDTTIYLNKTRIDIRYPQYSNKKTILVLPGWNFPQDDICNKSDFCITALEKGFTLILPDMKKSIYHSRLFHETRVDRKEFHTVFWLIDSFIPYIQKNFNLLNSDQKNFMLGISTGGRGVALLAIKTGQLFAAGAALSGDFDQSLMPNDKLMQSYYGSYKDFEIRWKTIDNPAYSSDSLQIPLLLAHGENDKIVPAQQSIIFYNKIKKQNKSHKLIIIPDAGHDYNFWNSLSTEILHYYNSVK